ncbi:hypothetical protein [Mucilaginibacter polytrichastri]|uniref:DUF2281 domain-containing protein n=1 Tax=Mucilaginibacter polytrichastri TaxID=1302689 RepID=A0A1Q6A4Q6_9SPHI|nr:hypothetical protein [Mucilaginibacter polytrichastri]OKS88989.1 hypothetical protein RG47T_4467 [Mucilaginibacter polytrichastri]SFS95166.1 hypothetical protein SAMN04487890_10728 [Mucilaginibacter polytrichastri]
MTKRATIKRILNAINHLPKGKVKEISDFTKFVAKRYDEQHLSESIQQMTAKSESFSFLNNDEDLYSEADLKEVY